MSSQTELLESRLDSSGFDPVIWEDVLEVTDKSNEKIDAIETLVLDFIWIVSEANPELANRCNKLLTQYKKQLYGTENI